VCTTNQNIILEPLGVHKIPSSNNFTIITEVLSTSNVGNQFQGQVHLRGRFKRLDSWSACIWLSWNTSLKAKEKLVMIQRWQ